MFPTAEMRFNIYDDDDVDNDTKLMKITKIQ